MPTLFEIFGIGFIPDKDLKSIMKLIALNRDNIIAQWYDYFNK